MDLPCILTEHSAKQESGGFREQKRLSDSSPLVSTVSGLAVCGKRRKVGGAGIIRMLIVPFLEKGALTHQWLNTLTSNRISLCMPVIPTLLKQEHEGHQLRLASALARPW